MRAVLERDFLSESSSMPAFRARSYMAVLVATAVAVFLYSVKDRLRIEPDQASLYVFRIGVGALLFLAALMTPAATVGAVLSERVQQTLSLVLTTPVGAVRFAFAKHFARVSTVLFWTLSAVPPLSICVLLGGVSGTDLLRTGVLVTAIVIELAAWAVFISAFSSRLATAAVLSYMLPVARWGGSAWYGYVVVSSTVRGGSQDGEIRSVLHSVSVLATTPLNAGIQVLNSTEYAGGVQSLHSEAIRVGLMPGNAPHPWGYLSEPVLWYFLTSCALSFVLLCIAGLRLRREGEPRADLFSLLKWRPWTTRPGRSRPRRIRAPGTGNPVTWRERRMVNTGASRPLYYATIVLLLVGSARLLLDVMGGFFNGTTFHSGEPAYRSLRSLGNLLPVGTLLLALVSAVTTAAAVGHERTQGTWDLLRASPLSARELVTGKFLGALNGIAFMTTVPVITILIGVLAGVFGILPLSIASIPCFVSVLLWSAVGLRLGIRFRKPTAAVMATILIFSCSFAVPPALGNIAHWGASHLKIRGNPNLAIRSASPWITVSHGVSSGLELPVGPRHRFWAIGGGPPEAWAWLWIAAHGSLATVLLLGAPRAMEDSMRREAEDG